MAWFGKNKSGTTAEGERSLERQEIWRQALERNEMPGFVRERLTKAAQKQIPWLSTMTPAELLLTKSHGIIPLATVSGTCWMHYGYSWTLGHAQGWRTAVYRMKEEAAACGANAVVDVKLRSIPLQIEGSMDFTIVGTAVRIEGLPPSSDPAIATVPALEFARLVEAGIVPCGIAIGADYEWLNNYQFGGFSFGYQNFDGAGTWWNQPLTQLGDFWQGVRRRALMELMGDAGRSGDGVLAHTHFGQLIRFEQENAPARYLGRHIVMGTVVDTGSSKTVPHDIRTVVDMRDGGLEAAPRTKGPVYGEGGEI